MDELIARLEAAGIGGAALNGEIWWRTDRKSAERCYWNAAMGRPKPLPDAMPSGLGRLAVECNAPPFTTSLDAALTLVPEGWFWQVSNRASKPHAGRAFLNNGELIYSGIAAAPNAKYRYSEYTAATPALALCIAALKARSHTAVAAAPERGPAAPQEK